MLWAIPAFVLAWLLWTRSPHALGARWGLRAARCPRRPLRRRARRRGRLGDADPLAPLPPSPPQTHELPFRPISSLADLDREVSQAKAAGKSVLVDFSADWCTSCKEMERYTFTDPAVQAALDSTVLLRANVTREQRR